MAEAFLWFLMSDDFRSISEVLEILHISPELLFQNTIHQ